MFKILFLFLFSITTFAANTLTILNFDNNSAIKKYNPLGKGIADMLTTDLTYIKGLKIVEREKLNELLKEINLSKTGFVDKKTALKIGKGLNANWILKGSFTIVKEKIRIDVNVIDTESSVVVDSVFVEGNVNNFFKLQKELVKKITKAIKTDEELIMDEYEKNLKTEVKNFDSIISFSKAIELYDNKKYKEAEAEFKKSLEFDNNFSYSAKYIDKLKERLKEYDKKNIEVTNEKVKEFIKNYDTIKKDDNGGVKFSMLSAQLMTTYEYTELRKLIEFVKKDLPKSTEFFKVDEYVQYSLILTHYMLKEDELVLKEGENFLKNFPGSMYFTGVQNYVDSTIEKIKKIEAGTKEYEDKLKEEEDNFKTKTEETTKRMNETKKLTETAKTNYENSLKMYKELFDFQKCSIAYTTMQYKKTFENCEYFIKTYPVSNYTEPTLTFIYYNYSNFGKFTELRKFCNDIKEKNPKFSQCNENNLKYIPK